MSDSSTLDRRIDESARQRFEAAWSSGQPGPIEQYLPSPDDGRFLATLEELVHIEIELAWKRARHLAAEPTTTVPQPPRLESYLERFGVLRADEILLRLIRQEWVSRYRYGDRPCLQEYRQRFSWIEPDLLTRTAQSDGEEHGAVPTPGPPAERIDRYLVQAEHGRGGFGVVWRAIDPKLGRQIAVKQLSGSTADDENSRRRFINEARISARLEHPGVVPVHDLGAVDAQEPFYTMKLVAGETLAEAIDRFHSPQSPPSSALSPERHLEQVRLLGSFLAVVNTMEYVHAQGVIHRDLKPKNIVLGRYGETVILDWGLAKVLEEDPAPADTIIAQALSDSQETLQGTVQGTPAYMSPEQAAGRIDEVDERSDIYALGVILYQMLTGRLPFDGRTSGEVLRQVREEEPPRLRTLNAAIPRPLEAICSRCMAKRRQDRYAKVAELRHDLERYLADEPVSCYREPASVRMARWSRRHRTAVVSGGVALLLLCAAAIGGLILWQREAQRRLGDEQRMIREAAKLRSAAEADHESALAELRADRYASAQQFLRQALGSLDGKSEDFDDLRVVLAKRLNQAGSLEEFHRLANEAEKLAFLEYDELALAACEDGLRRLEVFAHSDDWWLRLPTDDLSESQRSCLQRDAYRQLLFLAAVRLKLCAMTYTPAAARACETALRELEPAHAFHRAQMRQDSYAGRLLENGFRLRLGRELKEAPTWSPNTAADRYFLGLAHTWVEAIPDSDPVKLMLSWFGPKIGHNFADSSTGSAAFLRAAAALEPRHYWAPFWLGWSVLESRPGGAGEMPSMERLSQAELAFNTCIALRPDFAFAYGERAKLLLWQTHHAKDPKRQQELFDRMRLDLAQAARFGAHEPDILLVLATCWQALNEPDKSLEAYAGVLDRQPPLEAFRHRRGYQEKQNGLKHLLLFVTKVAEGRPKSEDVLAIKAHAVFALGNDDAALREAERALALRENARARTVRGFIHLRRGQLAAAADDFQKAADREPSSYLAAAGRARTLELLKKWDDALSSYDNLLGLAKAYWQTAEAHLGRSRVLAEMGRQPHALQAEAAASRLYAAFGEKPVTFLFR